MRVQGVLKDLPKSDDIPAGLLLKEVAGELSAVQQVVLDQEGDIDFGFSHGQERFRAHLYRTSRGLSLALRHLPSEVPSAGALGIPALVEGWAKHDSGLVIVTGPTGSGKTTTVAALISEINRERACHILTIEDPVEYNFPPGKALVVHREVGTDTSGFARAVRAGLRENLDVLVIGEMRDQQTVEAALAVAETGHLVLATLHTSNTSQAIDRLIDAFPHQEQTLARSRLAACLLGVVYQRLLPAVNGGRVAAFEVLAANSAVRAMIRDEKTYQIPNVLETSRPQGMQSMRHALEDLLATGQITKETFDAFLSKSL